MILIDIIKTFMILIDIIKMKKILRTNTSLLYNRTYIIILIAFQGRGFSWPRGLVRAVRSHPQCNKSRQMSLVYKKGSAVPVPGIAEPDPNIFQFCFRYFFSVKDNTHNDVFL